MAVILELRQATKQFGGVPAIKDIDLSLQEREIHAIVGENGAGKSTLMKALAGVYELTSGEILMRGKPLELSSPSDSLKLGIAMVFQEPNLVPSMTVAQNIYLGEESFFNRLKPINVRAKTFLRSLNFDVDPKVMVSSLGAAKKQLVEIARAVHHKAQVMIFDEPTAALTPEEKNIFFGLVQRLKKQGVSVIFISHALEDSLILADRISVLRDGELIFTKDSRELDRERIIEAMVGKELSRDIHSRECRRPQRPPGEKILSVKNLSLGGIVRNSSFSIFSKQVTCVFGLVGAGRSETFKIIAGAMKRDLYNGGEVRFCGKRVRYTTPNAAITDGIAYVTEDRKLEGFFEMMTIGENVHMGELATGNNPICMVTRKEERRLANQWTKKLGLKAIDRFAKLIEISGGNQQKVVFAKSLVQKPRLVIFDEPTHGVDVGAIVEIHQIIEKLADEGVAVVVISSYLPEVMAISDRILVARKGRIVEEMNILEATENAIMYAAVH